MFLVIIIRARKHGINVKSKARKRVQVGRSRVQISDTGAVHAGYWSVLVQLQFISLSVNVIAVVVDADGVAGKKPLSRSGIPSHLSRLRCFLQASRSEKRMECDNTGTPETTCE